MKAFKRVIALGLAVTLTAGAFLTGCGKNTDTGASTTTNSTTSSTASESTKQEELKPVDLTWYQIGNWPQKDQDEVFKAVSDKVEKKINAKVNFKVLGWGDYESKLNVLIAVGDQFDLCLTAGGWPLNYSQNVAKGAFLEVNDLMKQYAPKTYANVPADLWKATEINGKTYAVLNYQIVARTPIITTKKEYADEFGLDESVISNKFDLKAFEPFLEKMKVKYPNTSVSYNLFFMQDVHGMEYIAGEKVPGAIKITDDKTVVFNQYESQEFRDAVNTLRDWNKKGYVKGQKLLSYGDAGVPLNEKQTGIFSLYGAGATWKPGGEMQAKQEWGYDTLDIKLAKPLVTTGAVTGTMTAISSTSKNPERAMMLVELMNTDADLYNTLNYGIEDKHYKKTGENRIETVKDSGFAPGMQWAWATNFLAYLTPDQPDTVWDETKELNKTATKSPILGFIFNAEPVKSEIAKCQAVFQKYYLMIMYGLVSEKDYDKFINDMKAAGGDKVMAEMQKQIDTWKAAK